jgi:hypothetical protein
MSNLFSSLLIFTIIKTILSTFFLTVSKFYKNLVIWALTEMLCSVAGMTTLDREWSNLCDTLFILIKTRRFYILVRIQDLNCQMSIKCYIFSKRPICCKTFMTGMLFQLTMPQITLCSYLRHIKYTA